MAKRSKNALRAARCLLLCALMLAPLYARGALADGEGAALAADLTKSCTFLYPENRSAQKRMLDGDAETRSAFTDGHTLSLSFPDGSTAAALYLEWHLLPGAYAVEQLDASGNTLLRTQYPGDMLNCVHPLDPAARAVRLAHIDAETTELLEVRVYGPGLLPDGVIDWLPTPEKLDLLLISSHPDDEHVFMGGILPLYAGERGLQANVMYMTHQRRLRQNEALLGVACCGVRSYPVFLGLRDVYTRDPNEVREEWGEERTLSLLVAQLRRLRPEVVVTHDTKGEYGHAAHIVTAALVQRAVPLAADASYDPESAAQYGAWQVKKLYLHLYPENPIVMDWRQPLAAFGGMTALDVAKKAFTYHVSQHKYYFHVLDEGPTANNLYGLAYTLVGPDEAGGDLLEHIDASALTNYVPPTPSPSPTPSPTPEPTPVPVIAATAVPTLAPSPTPEPAGEAGLPVWLAFAAVAFTLLIAALLLLLRIRRRR